LIIQLFNLTYLKFKCFIISLFKVNPNCLYICDKTDFWKSHIKFENEGSYLKRGPQYNPNDLYATCNKLQRDRLIKNTRLNNNKLIIELNHNGNNLFPQCNNTQFLLIIKLKSIENINNIISNYFDYDYVSKIISI
jgi:hypothetical protein